MVATSLSACSGGQALSMASVDSGPGPGADAGQQVDAGPPPNEYTAPSADWCQRLVPGPPKAEAPAVSLSAAHATVRYFGLLPDGPLVSLARFDEPLIASLERSTAAAPDLTTYASGLLDVCVVAPGQSELPVAQVTLQGTVAWLRPGSGPDPVIPEGAQAVVIDLRELPDVPALDAALSAATRVALATALPRPDARVRAYAGLPDTYYLEQAGLGPEADVYSQSVEVRSRPAWPGTAARPRSLAVVTGPHLAPLAAELALTLRLTDRAALVGHDVLARVAESTYQPVGTSGLAIRTAMLELAGVPLPDVVPADVFSDTPERVLRSADDVSRLANARLTGLLVGRAMPQLVDVKNHRPAKALSPAQLSAALLVAHGTARRFWPIYDTWNPAIDARLVAQLNALPTTLTRRSQARRFLEHFASALNDAHVSVSDLRPDSTTWDAVAIAGLGFEVVDGVPVVSFSSEPGVSVGDTVTTVDGAPVADYLAREVGFVSAASPLTGLHLAAATLAYLPATGRQLGLKSATGAVKTASVQPQAGTPVYPPFGPQRPSGWLGDLGAPSLYYLNLNGYAAAPETEAQLLTRLNTASTAKGLIIDGRGYPGVELSTLIARVVGASQKSPQYLTPRWLGDGQRTLELEQYTFPAAAPSVTVPVALLVGPTTQSAAETQAMTLLERKDLKVVGRRTSASNGNVTSVALPGGFGMIFTGMQVRFSDGRPFAGVGVVPTVDSSPSVQDIAQGVDRELVDAVALLKPVQ